MKQEWSRLVVACMMVCACRGYAYKRVMNLNSRSRGPSVFRPGASLLRPNWAAPQPPARYVQAASNRSPYVFYKNPLANSGSRYSKPHYSNKFSSYVSGPWRSTMRVPTTSSAYEFVRVAASTSPPLRVDGDRGPIYTIPAPNLSLSDKPIVVMESHFDYSTAPSNAYNKTRMYEVTEKTIDPMSLGLGPKFMAPPSGPQMFTYSKASSLTSPEVLELMRNSAQQFQLADTYPLPILQQPQLLRHTALGPQLTLQGFNAIMQPSTGTDPDTIQQNILFKPDPNYVHKISNQLYQRFPEVEFYQYPLESNTQTHMLINPEEPKAESEHVNVIRATDEGTVMALMPETKPVILTSTTANAVQNVSITEEPTTVLVLNFTSEVTTVKPEEKITTTTEIIKDTPIYYPQIGENVGSIVASGFYSALTDVRAAEALASIEKTEQESPVENKTEQTAASELKSYFVQNSIKKEENKTTKENKTDLIKPHPGSPFTKSEPTNKIAYSFLRREGDTKNDITKDGARLAGQIVEASISDDVDFNHEKAALHRRPTLRLYSYETTTEKPRKIEVKSKTKNSKSKLPIDAVTGEPVIRIYASYGSGSKSSEKREPQGFTTRKSTKKEEPRSTYPNVRTSTPHTYEGWKTSSVQHLERMPTGADANQVTQFGLKLRPRMDDYTSIFEYEE